MCRHRYSLVTYTVYVHMRIKKIMKLQTILAISQCQPLPLWIPSGWQATWSGLPLLPWTSLCGWLVRVKNGPEWSGECVTPKKTSPNDLVKGGKKLTWHIFVVWVYQFTTYFVMCLRGINGWSWCMLGACSIGVSWESHGAMTSLSWQQQF